MDKQTGKRIVSKGAYFAKVGKKTGISAFGVMLLSLCLICILMAFLLLTQSGDTLGIVLGLVFGGGSLYVGYLGTRTMQEAKQIDPGIPLTRANTADLPAPVSLVRASEEPGQEQQTELLRAATEATERHEGQLVRASAGGRE